ncbi:hypothetical protein GOP47_0030728 [Adiantum capillus-veneris]|nr:hypothetical protein GOP47_0030728 [Adiantum capillus-veneris]
MGHPRWNTSQGECGARGWAGGRGRRGGESLHLTEGRLDTEEYQHEDEVAGRSTMVLCVRFFVAGFHAPNKASEMLGLIVSDAVGVVDCHKTTGHGGAGKGKTGI